jgi:hypothetical protein
LIVTTRNDSVDQLVPTGALYRIRFPSDSTIRGKHDCIPINLELVTESEDVNNESHSSFYACDLSACVIT